MGKLPSLEFSQRLVVFYFLFFFTENPTKVIWVEGENLPLSLLGMPMEGNKTWWGAGVRCA